MREIFGLNITNLVFAAAFLFAVNLIMVQHFGPSFQITGEECNLKQITEENMKNEPANKNVFKTSFLSLDIDFSDSIIFEIQLGQLQLTIDTEL